MKLYYKYFNTFEACYNLLICLTQSQTSNLHNRIVSIITEKSGIPNYTINTSHNNTMVLNRTATRSHLYEGLIKYPRILFISNRSVSRGLMLLWNEPIVTKNVGYGRWFDIQCSQLTYPQQLLTRMVQYFNNLVAFIIEVYRDALLSNTVLSYPLHLIGRVIHRGSEAKQEEMKEVRLLYLMLLRCIQILRLFIYVRRPFFELSVDW